jgi:hypothetical protein
VLLGRASQMGAHPPRQCRDGLVVALRRLLSAVGGVAANDACGNGEGRQQTDVVAPVATGSSQGAGGGEEQPLGAAIPWILTLPYAVARAGDGLARWFTATGRAGAVPDFRGSQNYCRLCRVPRVSATRAGVIPQCAERAPRCTRDSPNWTGPHAGKSTVMITSSQHGRSRVGGRLGAGVRAARGGLAAALALGWLMIFGGRYSHLCLPVARLTHRHGRGRRAHDARPRSTN